MLNKTINSIIYFIIGISCIILGFTSIFIGTNILRLTLTLTSVLLVINAILRIYNVVIKKDNLFYNLSRSTLDIVGALLIVYNMSFVINSFIRLLGLYILFNAIIFFITYLIYMKYNIKGRILVFFKFLIYIIFASLLILHPAENSSYAQIIVGVYLIIYGLSSINDFLIETISVEKANKLKKLIKIPLPLFMTAFIPQRLINLINEVLVVDDNDELYDKKSDKTPDLEVLIHLAEKGTAAFGHVEICFENKIYSYGNYNKHSRKFFDMIGDGILLIADRDSYIKYNVENLNRYLVCFGLKLTDSEKRSIRKRITYLFNNNTVDWQPDAELADLNIIPAGEYKEVSSDLYRYANAKFKKITKGRNKKFFVLRTNCAIITDYVLGSINSTILNINGLIAPGTYYEYLNNEFMKKNSNVITRKIYTKNNYQD